MDKLKLSHKLLLLSLIPLLGLLYFSSLSLVVNRTVLTESEQSLQIAELAVLANNLVHEIQKERGMTAGFLNSSGNKFVRELPQQRLKADSQKQILDDYLKQFDDTSYGTNFSNSLSAMVRQGEQIAKMRSKVDQQAVVLKDAISFYTAFNTKLLGLGGFIPSLTTDATLAKLSGAYGNFSQSKERAGIERAILTATFAQDRFNTTLLVRFISLVATQDAYIKVFERLATEEQQQFYSNTMSDAFVEKTAEFRKIAIDRSRDSSIGVDPETWFKTITGKIGLLKKVENRLADDVREYAELAYDIASRAMLFSSIVCVILIALTLGLFFYISRDVLTNLGAEPGSLLAVAEKIADGELNFKIGHPKGVMAAMDDMHRKLLSVVGEVRSGSDSIASASQQLSATAQTISQGATEQAAAAEQTSSAISQFNSSIAENSENSTATNRLASQSAAGIQQGGAAVNDTVSAMKQIAQKVDLIEDCLQDQPTLSQCRH